MDKDDDTNRCRDEIHGILSAQGIVSGDVIYLGVDIGALPLPKYLAEVNRASILERQNRWCSFVLESLQSYLGPAGTILAPSFSYSCTQPGSVYIHETTPSETGPFTEYLRAHESAVRSLHPIFSVSGIGAKAHEILDDCGHAAFGAMSPFARLQEHGCKFLCLGTRISQSLTYIHHLEQSYGCNNRYHKMFTLKVEKGGQLQQGPWMAYLAFRSLKSRMQCQGLEDELIEQGVLKQYECNGRPNQCAHIDDVTRIGYEMLRRNPCTFMTSDVEVVLEEDDGLASPVDTPRAVFDLIARRP